MTEKRHNNIQQQHNSTDHTTSNKSNNTVLRHTHSDPIALSPKRGGGVGIGQNEGTTVVTPGGAGASTTSMKGIIPMPSAVPPKLPLATTTTTKKISAGGAITGTTADHNNSSNNMILMSPVSVSSYSWIRASASSFVDEFKLSTDPVFNTKLTILLVFGPAAIINEATRAVSEYWSFLFAGMALIPCAERLSFITEQVAEHTNSTVGALLNATFGNAPELLISIAALRSGYYRVVQLTMLGSMLTNLMLVFGIACIIGGCKYQVQHIRQSSGNVSVLLLLVATAGSLLPAALVLSGQFPSPEADSKDDKTNPSVTHSSNHTSQQSSTSSSFYTRSSPNVPSDEEVTLCRVNAAVMLILYLCYLIFQMGTHREEFDDEESIVTLKRHAKRNVACQKLGTFFFNVITKPSRLFRGLTKQRFSYAELSNLDYSSAHESDVILNDDSNRSDVDFLDEAEQALVKHGNTKQQPLHNNHRSDPKSPILRRNVHHNDDLVTANHGTGPSDLMSNIRLTVEKRKLSDHPENVSSLLGVQHRRQQQHQQQTVGYSANHINIEKEPARNNSSFERNTSTKSKDSDILTDDEEIGDDTDENYDRYLDMMHDLSARSGLSGYSCNRSGKQKYHEGLESKSKLDFDDTAGPLLSFRVGVAWLFIITLCISAMSDILVDTIGGFADKMNLSQVFTSMVIIPFFSNVAEQVSAFLFAYRNEMDLCVGVTVGSAIQIATMVLPGSVLIGMVLDRNMTLYFHTFETVCLFFGVIVVAVILQSGTTNWLVGAMLVGIYTMFAAGVWFHEKEDLSIDLEDYGTSG